MTAHVHCPRCRRLLVPTSARTLPMHRTPPRKGTYRATTQPLTGRDAQWCPASGQRTTAKGTP